MVIVLTLYASLCVLLLVVAVKLLMAAFRTPAQTSEVGGDDSSLSNSDPMPSHGPTDSPELRRSGPRWVISRGGSASRRRDEVVDMLERQFNNSPSLSNYEE